MEEFLSRLAREPIDWRFEGFPATDPPVTPGELGEQGWNVLEGDLPLPAMIVKTSAIEHNLELMAGFCRANQVELAPHGKTTMAPQLLHRQLRAGAWGVTAATVRQARAFHAWGVRRVLLANQIVQPEPARWAARTLAADPGFTLSCLVDSPIGVSLLEEALSNLDSPPLPVLVELGIPGGRTGCRTVEEALEVGRAAAAASRLRLIGVEGFEGLLGRDERLDRYLTDLRELAVRLDRQGSFQGEAIISAGGSCHFDRVVEILAGPWELSVPATVVLRSGCYLTHDHGLYEECSPWGRRGADGHRLRPALELWAAVSSRPEPDLAIATFGRRDAPHDADLPVPLLRRSEEGVEEVRGRLEVVALDDQHAYLRLGEDLVLRVGDLVGCGISHPCTAFDKWGLLPEVDDDYRVTGAIRTFF